MIAIIIGMRSPTFSTLYIACLRKSCLTLYGKSRHGETTFTFVDGFCGGGVYYDTENNQSWLGSPIRIIQAVRKGFQKANRTLDINVNYIFIDKNKHHLDCLKNHAFPCAGLGELVDGKVHKFTINLDFSLEEQYQQLSLFDDLDKKILKHSQNLFEQCEFINLEFEKYTQSAFINSNNFYRGHSLFILDPFSWEHISMQSIRMINDIKGSEIIYTYMIDELKRWVFGKKSSLSKRKKYNTILEAEGYYESVQLKDLESIEEQRHLRNESLRLFREKGNADYAHTFSLIPRGYKVVLYYLMHFSKNLTALQVMRDTLWKYNNLTHIFEFEVYGFGFKTVDFYRSNMKLDFYIEDTIDSQEGCIKILDKYLMQHLSKDGEAFFNLCDRTMQLNPSCLDHYINYFNQKRQDKEIEIIRDGKIISSKTINLRKKDIIRLSNTQQLYIFKKPNLKLE
ncbi:three-Cys-motif partner protein TcmP [Planktothrix agardhii]|uniref:three-Cys-motif partner protein TcmP n=1 Tax=Planktothrix agardhii TaxID=1160 RepID=UPI0028753112|nr:three-Cys-motif partner protein TcmP [Planktothrix agardhii]MDS1347141.1 three-Cys-motif partner protein TcmP [Planktothrix agardhii NRERC-751]